MSNLLEDIEGAEPIVDDILVWERDAEEHVTTFNKCLSD